MSKQVKPIIVGVDVDGVLRDFESKVVEVINQQEGSAVPLTAAHIFGQDSKYKHYWQDINSPIAQDIFKNSPMIAGRLDEFKELQRWGNKQNPKVKFICVTAQMPALIHCTLYWLGNNGFNFSTVITEQQKYKAPIDYLIDDMNKNYDAWIANGRTEESFILMNTDLNIDCKASGRIDNLQDAIKFIK